PPGPSSGTTSAPGPAPTAAATSKPDNNPFAVFSEGQAPPGASTRPAAASPPGAEASPPDVPPQDAPPPADGKPAAGGERNDLPLDFLTAAAQNRGNPAQFRDPPTGAMSFLNAIKEKDLNKIAQATALRAATESKNQKLFQLILAQELAQEDVDELAKKLDKFQIVGQNQFKSSGSLGIIITKPEGTSIMRRTITTLHERGGWKVLDITGEGEIEKPIALPRMSRGGYARGRR